MPEFAKNNAPLLTAERPGAGRGKFDKAESEDLLPRVALGDPAAVSLCLERYGGLVWSLTRKRLQDVQAAEDAVQDIFIKIWSVADRFNPELASEATFIAMIARRRLIDILRKRELPVGETPDFSALSDTQPSAADRLELCDEAARAAELLDQLPEDQQRVIRLSVYEGLSHSRIAETTGLSLGTVKTHLRRGILKLRNTLFGAGAGPDASLQLSTGEVAR